jgi:vitamin B12 transporter
MRGTESNHTLVLIDGVRMNPGTIGGAAIQHISPEVIERVEIVKGARSALFGTDAIGGVINIITRRADETHIEGGAGAGSFDSRSAFLSGGVRNDKNQFGITLDWQDTDGYPPRVESEIERGYDNFSLNAHATRDIGHGEISLRHWRAEGTVEYLDFFLTPVDQDFRNFVTAFQFDTNPTGSAWTGSTPSLSPNTRSPEDCLPCRKPRSRCPSVPGSTRTRTSRRYFYRTNGSAAGIVHSSLRG